MPHRARRIRGTVASRPQWVLDPATFVRLQFTLIRWLPGGGLPPSQLSAIRGPVSAIYSHVPVRQRAQATGGCTAAVEVDLPRIRLTPALVGNGRAVAGRNQRLGGATPERIRIRFAVTALPPASSVMLYRLRSRGPDGSGGTDLRTGSSPFWKVLVGSAENAVLPEVTNARRCAVQNTA